MGILYLKHGQQQTGKAAVRHRHAQNCYLMASRHLEHEEWEEARHLLARALELHDGHLPTLRALANLEFTLGNLPQAHEYLDRLLEQRAPEDSETLFLLGNIELSDGNIAAALKAYTRADELGDPSPELTFNIGLSHLLLGHGQQAAEVFTRLVEEQPANGRSWDALGCALRLEKQYQEAMHAFLQALQADPDLNDSRDHMAQMLLEMANPRQARQVLETALAIEPDRASSRHLLGLAYATLQDYPRAIACWEELIASDGALPETYHLLANAYMQNQDRPHAVKALQRLLEINPFHLSGQLQLALLLFEEGKVERGWVHLEKARTIDPQNLTVIQLLNAAETMHPRRDG